MDNEKTTMHEHLKVKVCSKCKQTNFETYKHQFDGSSHSFSLNQCLDCDEVVQTEYTPFNEHETINNNFLLEQALEEIAHLNKRIARYQKADTARDEKLRASLQPTQEQIIEADTATAASIYEDFGRDEWPSPV